MTSLKLSTSNNNSVMLTDNDHLRVRIPSYSASSTLSSASSSLSQVQNSSATHHHHHNDGEEYLDVVVVFPNGVQINKKIDPKKAIYDLLIELTSSVKLMPTHYVLRLFSHVDESSNSKSEEDRVIEYTPNQLIGSLNPAKIKIVTKTATLKHHHQYQIMNMSESGNGTSEDGSLSMNKSVTLNRNNSGQQQQPFEFKTRIEVNLPFNQKTVVRVRPDTSLSDLFVVICKEACLDGQLYELRIYKNNDVKGSSNGGRPESMSDSYSSYNAKEVTLILKSLPTSTSASSKTTHSMFAKFRNGSGGGTSNSSSSKSASLKKKSSAEIFLSKKSSSATLAYSGASARDKSKSELDLRYSGNNNNNGSIREEDENEMSSSPLNNKHTSSSRHDLRGVGGGATNLNKSIMDMSSNNSISNKKSTTSSGSKNSSSLFNFFTRRKSKDSSKDLAAVTALSKSKLSLNTIDQFGTTVGGSSTTTINHSHVDLSLQSSHTHSGTKPIIGRPLSSVETSSQHEKTFSSATNALINKVKKRMAPPPPTTATATTTTVESKKDVKVETPPVEMSSNGSNSDTRPISVMSQQEVEKVKLLSKSKNKKAPPPPPPTQPTAAVVVVEESSNESNQTKSSDQREETTRRVVEDSSVILHSSSSSVSPPSSPRSSSSFPSPSLSDASSSFARRGEDTLGAAAPNTTKLATGSMIVTIQQKNNTKLEVDETTAPSSTKTTTTTTQLSTFTVAKIIKNSLVMPVAAASSPSSQTITTKRPYDSSTSHQQARQDNVKVSVTAAEIVSIQTSPLSSVSSDNAMLASLSSSSTSDRSDGKKTEENDMKRREEQVLLVVNASSRPCQSTNDPPPSSQPQPPISINHIVQISKKKSEHHTSSGSEEEGLSTSSLSQRSVVIRTINDSFRSNISSSDSCTSSTSSSNDSTAAQHEQQVKVDNVVTNQTVNSEEEEEEVKQKEETLPIIPPRRDDLSSIKKTLPAREQSSSVESCDVSLEMNLRSAETSGTYRLLTKRTAVIETSPEYLSATIFVPPLQNETSSSLSSPIESKLVQLSRQESTSNSSTNSGSCSSSSSTAPHSSSSSTQQQQNHFPAYEEKELNEQHANFMVKRHGEIIEKNGVYFSHDGSVRGYPGIVKKFAQSRTLKEIFVKQQELDTRREQCSSNSSSIDLHDQEKVKPVTTTTTAVATPTNITSPVKSNNFSAYRRSQPPPMASKDSAAHLKTELENELSRKLEQRRQVISDQMKNEQDTITITNSNNKLKSSFQTKPTDNNSAGGLVELTTSVLHHTPKSLSSHHVNKSSPSFVMSAKSKKQLDHQQTSVNPRSSLLNELKSVVPLVAPIDPIDSSSTRVELEEASPSPPSSPPLPPPPPFLSVVESVPSSPPPVINNKPLVAPKNFSSNTIKSLNSKTQVLNARDNLMESIKTFQFGSLKRSANNNNH